MIKAYVVGIESLYEGEDIEIRYSIYKEDELIGRESFYEDYKKPILVTQLAIQKTLKELAKFKQEEIELIINDGSTYSLLEETSMPKNQEAIKLAKVTRRKLKQFNNLTLVNVSADHRQIEEWDSKITF